jgi:hypothetical protein
MADEATGDERRARSTKVGRLADDELVRRYKVLGVGIRTLVTESGLSYGTVRKRLHVAGVLRPVGIHAPATLDEREG